MLSCHGMKVQIFFEQKLSLQTATKLAISFLCMHVCSRVGLVVGLNLSIQLPPDRDLSP